VERTQEGTKAAVAAVDFLKVTERAAIESARWLGRGDNHSADQAAVDAMRAELGEMPITGTVVIGEGQKDEAPELYVGEVLGQGGMECEIAVDPLEGTDLVARGDSGAVAICAIGEPGGLMPAPDIYMQKLVVGATARGRVSIDAPIAETLDVVARCYGRALRDTTAIVLDRPRHEELIEEIRAAGARIRLIPDGDITASLSVAVRGTGDHRDVGTRGITVARRTDGR
jgi:fructose-1,6-bisphosphatase II